MLHISVLAIFFNASMVEGGGGGREGVHLVCFTYQYLQFFLMRPWFGGGGGGGSGVLHISVLAIFFNASMVWEGGGGGVIWCASHINTRKWVFYASCFLEGGGE